jgi:hypothetical protein
MDAATSSEDEDFIQASIASRRINKNARRKSTPSSRKKPKLYSHGQQRQVAGKSVTAPTPVEPSRTESAVVDSGTNRVLLSVQACLTPQAPSPAQQATCSGGATADTQQLHAEHHHQHPPAAAVGSASCPVCSVSLSSISETEAGRTAHVNACLDEAAGGSAALASLDEDEQDCEHVDMTASQADEQSAQDDEPDSMQQWWVAVALILHELLGLVHFPSSRCWPAAQCPTQSTAAAPASNAHRCFSAGC